MNSELLTYEYSQGDLLENRHRYSYSQYHGVEFLKAWSTSRAAAAFPQESTSANLKEMKTKPLSDMFQSQEFEESNVFLNALLAASRSNGEHLSNLENHLLETLLKRFEAGKRIYSTYNSELRPESRDSYKNIDLYVLTASIFNAVYTSTGRIPFLNGLLKCLDIVVSYKEEISTEARPAFNDLLISEGKHIHQLCQLKGIDECL